MMKKWNPAFYDENSFMQYTTAMLMLKELLLSGEEAILDVGSGNGKISFELAKIVPKGKVLGIDVSDNMVQFARAYYQAANLNFEQCDVTAMTYHNCFDLVVSFWTLSWVEAQQKALVNIVNSLKDRGRFLLMYPLRHDVYDVIDNIIKKPEWQPYFQTFSSPRLFLTEQTYLDILKNLKAVTVNSTRKQLQCEFDNQEHMIRSIKSWIPHIDFIPDESKKDEFVESVAQTYLDAKNSISYIMFFNVLEISGVKNIIK